MYNVIVNNILSQIYNEKTAFRKPHIFCLLAYKTFSVSH